MYLGRTYEYNSQDRRKNEADGVVAILITRNKIQHIAISPPGAYAGTLPKYISTT